MKHSEIHHLLFEKLMEGVSAQTKNDELGFRLFSESTHEDLNKIEPTILKLLADRDEDLRVKMACGHPIVLMELAPLAEQPPGTVMCTENEHCKIVDAKKLVYRCSACHEMQKFVRAVTAHLRQGMTVERSLVEAASAVGVTV